jgi:hypothetical protein
MEASDSSAVMTDYSTLNAVRSAFDATAESIDRQTEEQIAAVYQLAEMIIVDERISLDDYLISTEPDAKRVADRLKGIVVPMRVDDRLRVTAAVNAVEFGASYPELEVHLPSLNPVITRAELDPPVAWAIMQELDRRDIPVEVRRRAEKLMSVSWGGSLPRTVYYYFLSRLLEHSYAPFAPRADLYKYLLELESAKELASFGTLDPPLTRDRVARTVLAHVEENAGEFARNQPGRLAELYKPLELPSVIRLVLDRARRNRMSIIETAVEIRESTEAANFRAFIARYHRALALRDVGEKNRIEHELRQICAYWASAPGITGMDNAKFRVSGGFLSMEFTWKSRIIKLPKALRPNKHLIFLHDVWKSSMQ